MLSSQADSGSTLNSKVCLLSLIFFLNRELSRRGSQRAFVSGKEYIVLVLEISDDRDRGGGDEGSIAPPPPNPRCEGSEEFRLCLVPPSQLGKAVLIPEEGN